MASMPTDYAQVFFDDFTGTSLNSKNWPLLYGGVSGTGPFTYTSSDIHIANGTLTIATTKTSAGWTTGGFSQGATGRTYGLYEVMARVGAGQGVGPAIVLWPTNNKWPAGGEIDLLEAPDGKNGTMTLHWANASGGNAYHSVATGVDPTQWHDYAVDWEPSQITFYVDGKAIWSTTQHIPTGNLSLGMSGYVANANDGWYGGGPNSTTPNTVNLDVAWVKISEPTPKFYAGPGHDVLTGTAASDWFFVTPTWSDGWAEIKNFQAGDKLALWDVDLAKAKVNWVQGTDKNGVAGATAQISVAGNGHIDESVTIAGVSVATAKSWTHWTSSSGGTPFAVFQG